VRWGIAVANGPGATPQLGLPPARRDKAPTACIGEAGEHVFIHRLAVASDRPRPRYDQPQSVDLAIAQLTEPVGDRGSTELLLRRPVGKVETEGPDELESRVLQVRSGGSERRAPVSHLDP